MSPSNPTAMTTGLPLLQVQDLCAGFKVRGDILRAVDGVSLEVGQGETVGLVGESGCGKSTTGRAIVGLVRPSSGEVLYRGTPIVGLAGREMASFRRRVQMIFQDPHSSLNPRMRVGETVGEALKIHRLFPPGQRKERVQRLLEAVGLSADAARRFPHEFSGGQRQRIGIARALAVEPELIVADEPVSALDVSVQAQIINLLASLREEFRLSYLFISHDLRLVAHFADRMAVMYLGRIVESGPAAQVVQHPIHPYTSSLVQSVPAPNPGQRWESVPLKGEVPSPLNPPSGCTFHPRCPLVQDVCRNTRPDFRSMGDGRAVACHRAHELAQPSPGDPALPS